MKKRYNVDIHRLKLGKHDFDFSIDDTFFRMFDQNELDRGNLTAQLAIDKREHLLEFTFDLSGHVVLVCDRSLALFDHPVKINKKIIFKYGEQAVELSEDLIMITKNQQEIDIAHFLYEFIMLAVPMKKLHPRFDNESTEDVLIYASRDSGLEADENSTDPRWEALRKLKDK